MKSFRMTVWGIVVFFALVMGFVAYGSFSRKSTSCKIDPAQLVKIREQRNTAISL